MVENLNKSARKFLEYENNSDNKSLSLTLVKL